MGCLVEAQERLDANGNGRKATHQDALCVACHYVHALYKMSRERGLPAQIEHWHNDLEIKGSDANLARETAKIKEGA